MRFACKVAGFLLGLWLGYRIALVGMEDILNGGKSNPGNAGSVLWGLAECAGAIAVFLLVWFIAALIANSFEPEEKPYIADAHISNRQGELRWRRMQQQLDAMPEEPRARPMPPAGGSQGPDDPAA